MLLQLTDISKKFADKTVLDSLSLSLDKGFCYALCGASGIGKTTLLRIVCGLEVPDSGTVTFPQDAVVSYAFQEPRLFDALTVWQNIEAIHPERDIHRLLEELDLLDAKDKYPHELSGGMKKRAGLARALAKNADIYLIDEPTGGQDTQRGRLIADAIRNYASGKLCIISAHDTELIRSVADHLIVLENGDVHQHKNINGKSTDEIQAYMQSKRLP